MVGETYAKLTVFGVLSAVLNLSDPQVFGAAVTGSLIYYILFADRGKWNNIILFIISVPMAVMMGPAVATLLHKWIDVHVNVAGITLFSGALGLLIIEKLASWVRNPFAFVRLLEALRSARRDKGDH